MTTGKLDIWITEPGEPCRITDETYFVAIGHCNGEVLDWCDQEYLGLRAECGHLEVEVPPGCYHIRAAQWIASGRPLVGNALTDSAVVEVSCGDTECVKLYAPAARTCGRIFARALEEFGDQMGVDPDLLDETLQNLDEIIPQLPRTAAVSQRLEQYDELIEIALEEAERDEPQGRGPPQEKEEREE